MMITEDSPGPAPAPDSGPGSPTSPAPADPKVAPGPTSEPKTEVEPETTKQLRALREERAATPRYPDPAVDKIPEPYPTVGRIVHFVLHDGPCKGQIRAAVVTRAWSGHVCNLQVFLDGKEDCVAKRDCYTEHLTSVTHAPKAAGTLRTWHWPARV